jgi:hypothetical protein
MLNYVRRDGASPVSTRVWYSKAGGALMLSCGVGGVDFAQEILTAGDIEATGEPGE